MPDEAPFNIFLIVWIIASIVGIIYVLVYDQDETQVEDVELQKYVYA
ncbi:MAG: hypothetical protein N3C60_02935 [Calditerrivibrio sp.]|nr:hypothetical protein [Calditerrivibrio sp.]